MKSMRKLAILGASGHGKVVAEVALAMGWQEVVFFDDAWPTLTKLESWPVIGDSAGLSDSVKEFDGVIVAIGNCATRWAKQNALIEVGADFATLIHPAATLSPSMQIGKGGVVMAGVIVNASATIGDAAILNTGSIVDHDCILGDAVHVAPGAVLSGDVVVGNETWIGVGASVRHGARIGAKVMVGAGAVVIEGLEDETTAIGCPAAPIR